ncbi:MAG TPA: hypothetical protein VLQ45_31465 [Thermoanaerobaculia bacterium]|nr:hypothetical protein [Thermoanaerobaculia bacterium]
MKKSLFATCLLLLALSGVMSPAATVDSTPVGLPDQLDAAGCCQRTCNVNSDCDQICGGPGAGECKKIGSCCSVCLCSSSGT